MTAAPKRLTMKQFAVIAFLSLPVHGAERPGTSPHTARLVSVAKNIKLEVLDWGGDGPPLIFLAGSGGTGHGFDTFAPRFIARHHVYAITRRGFGNSSKPPATEENYNADRLGDDVLAVIAALKLEKPYLAAHSFGGEELSSIGTRHPEAVAGLIYLEAAHGYAFDEPGVGSDIYLLGPQLNRHLWDLASDESQANLAAIKQDLERLQTAVRVMDELLQGSPPAVPAPVTPETRIYQAMWTGGRSYRTVKAPSLILFALPHQCSANCDKAKIQDRLSMDQADAIQRNNPSARIVRIAHATHLIFRSNPEDVEREMNAFMDDLPH
jgi:pimeloyl-ACP methyl ester carboxylesterase